MELRNNIESARCKTEKCQIQNGIHLLLNNVYVLKDYHRPNQRNGKDYIRSVWHNSAAIGIGLKKRLL